ncbi:Putative protein [Zobellia galactanivorans]|uniref:Uncharacterized protein n=1 Tax=Zobellia galactanivorans (strain DSM 12802 / CCUG 47099 / CIP 106680 / NCIMB 13871 / Dsij) TaxID=63186 RepID=G0LCV5_ZOBGA|nr:Putative protein [Zobellia galactanivorans]
MDQCLPFWIITITLSVVKRRQPFEDMLVLLIERLSVYADRMFKYSQNLNNNIKNANSITILKPLIRQSCFVIVL